ncbi:MAG TPA: hypothetical protein PLK99_01950, partial [Burkholderiales bacterium]|nr:hypothetical protein [Burkholderiales bacterium]
MKRILLFIADKQCIAIEWKGGMPDSQRVFPNSEEGARQFEAYLNGGKHFTAGILADLVEEDYRQESILHLGFRDRKRYLARKLGQYYRHTPFSSAAFQG